MTTATVALTGEPGATPGPYAGAVCRLTACGLDLRIVSALLAGGSAVAAYLVAVITGRRLGLAADRDLAGVALTVGWFVYFAGWWATTGRTPGMALFGLRVVAADGRRASPAAAVVRALAFPLSVALFGLGFLGILFDTKRRALHDLIARTLVVYTEPGSSPSDDDPVVPLDLG